MYKQQHITVVIPALNEALSIAKVVAELYALSSIDGPVIDDVIVCDNGSSDGTGHAAHHAGARVVVERRRGYGYACLCALAAIDITDVVVFVDADDCFFIEQTIVLLDAIDSGADLAIGSRTLGHIDPYALTPAQRFGNRLATVLIDKLWSHSYSDLGPFRAIKWRALETLEMRDTHYGWTVEMQVKAVIERLFVVDVPVDTRVRVGQSKISGTVSGTIKAGIGILGMIATLYWRQWWSKRQRRPCQHTDLKSLKNDVKPHRIS